MEKEDVWALGNVLETENSLALTGTQTLHHPVCSLVTALSTLSEIPEVKNGITEYSMS
jgi:hypothetical protein